MTMIMNAIIPTPILDINPQPHDMSEKSKLRARLIKTIAHQINEQERMHKDEIGYMDFASWGYEQGIILTIREAKLLLTIIKQPTNHPPAKT